MEPKKTMDFDTMNSKLSFGVGIFIECLSILERINKEDYSIYKRKIQIIVEDIKILIQKAKVNMKWV